MKNILLAAAFSAAVIIATHAQETAAAGADASANPPVANAPAKGPRPPVKPEEGMMKPTPEQQKQMDKMRAEWEAMSPAERQAKMDEMKAMREKFEAMSPEERKAFVEKMRKEHPMPGMVPGPRGMGPGERGPAPQGEAPQGAPAAH